MLKISQGRQKLQLKLKLSCLSCSYIRLQK